MVKVIRFANEGFHNYTQKIKLYGEETEVTGCYCFINKVIEKALRYDGSWGSPINILGLKNRNKDTKNIGFVNENAYVYARLVDPSRLEVREYLHGICVQPEDITIKDTESFQKISMSEMVSNIKNYQKFEKTLRRKAKDEGKNIAFYNRQYLIYEAIINKDDIELINNAVI